MKLLFINLQLVLIEAILAFGVELKFFPKFFTKAWEIIGNMINKIMWPFLMLIGIAIYCIFWLMKNIHYLFFKWAPYAMSGVPEKMFNALVKRKVMLIAMKQPAKQWKKDPRLA
jgi:hypothetical protein